MRLFRRRVALALGLAQSFDRLANDTAEASFRLVCKGSCAALQH